MKSNKTTAVAVSALVLGSLSTLSLSANANPFSAEQLNAGYQLASTEALAVLIKPKKLNVVRTKLKIKKLNVVKANAVAIKKTPKTKKKPKKPKCGEGKCGGMA